MSLKKATLLVMIAISYTFALRTMGTFLPDIFKNLRVAQVSVIISFLASLTMVVFFISFYKDYVLKEQTNLKKASVLAIIGSSAVSLLYIKGLLLVFNRSLVYIYNISPHLVRLIKSPFFGAIVPWVSSIFILLFFIIFHKEILRKGKTKLKNATLLAIIGSSIGTSLRTFALFNYFYSRELWFPVLSGKAGIISIPIITFGFITILYFFSSFYKEQK